jgi:uncharacterized protein YkuJ
MVMEREVDYVIYSEEKNSILIYSITFYPESNVNVFYVEDNGEYGAYTFDDFKERYDGSIWLGEL